MKTKYVLIFTWCIAAVLMFFFWTNEKLIFALEKEPIYSVDEALFSKFEGTWLSMDYLNRIIASHSPKKAVQEIKMWAYISIKKTKNNKYSWSTAADFHQGLVGEIRSLQTDNACLLIFEKGLKPGELEFQYLIELDKSDNNKIKCSRKGVTDIYFKISDEDIESYINKLIFSGTYSDSNGKIYKFTEDNQAIWPDRSFNYRINLDPVMSKYESIYLVDDKGDSISISYIYEFKGDNLYFYKELLTNESPVPERENKPFLVLEKQKVPS